MPQNYTRHFANFLDFFIYFICFLNDRIFPWAYWFYLFLSIFLIFLANIGLQKFSLTRRSPSITGLWGQNLSGFRVQIATDFWFHGQRKLLAWVVLVGVLGIGIFGCCMGYMVARKPYSLGLSKDRYSEN